jgi:prepilin-type N-terminal cleavage/methylation domain-containing protein
MVHRSYESLTCAHFKKMLCKEKKSEFWVSHGGQHSRPGEASGFSLIELIIVVALIAFAYTVALPGLGIRSESEIALKLNTLAGDVRNAFDLSVLTGKPYRLVFNLASGEYWLEEPDQPEFYLGSEKVDRDPTEAEEKDAEVAFEQKMREFEDAAGQVVSAASGDEQISPTSPVVEAKSRLRKAIWTRVSNSEWGKRSLGPELIIKEMQSEHHGRRQDFSELGDQARGMIYFFPQGYVEKAVLYLYYKKDDLVPDESKEPYTFITFPYEGVADVMSGRLEINVHEDQST